MKRVLIPTYPFFPLNNGGTFRIVKIAKFLQHYNWEPIVVAPDFIQKKSEFCTFIDKSMMNNDPCNVERVNWKSINELDYKFKLRKKIFDDPLLIYGDLYYSTLKKCQEICRNLKINCIFASSFPQYIHKIAFELNREFKIPWIADHRDIIDQEPLPLLTMVKRPHVLIRRKHAIIREKNYSRSAAIITTVSEGLANKLKKRNNSPVYIIMNGFDTEDFVINNKKKNSKFTIIYTGSLFGNSNPTVFFKGMNLLFDNNPGIKDDILVNFYGRCKDIFNKYGNIIKYNNMYSYKGYLSHKESINEICNADVLYFISHPNKGIATGKIFEYIASGRPILSVPGDGDISDKIISETKTGEIASTPEEVMRIIQKWFFEWKNTKTIGFHPNMQEINKYTRKGQIEILAGLMNGVCSNSKNITSVYGK